MKSHRLLFGFCSIIFAGIILAFLGAPGTSWGDHDRDDDDHGHGRKDDGNEIHRADERIQRGFDIAPVRLELKGRNKSLVGLGSYIVNAQSGCNDCHSCPSYAAGHNPASGGDGLLNTDHYLAGGVHFGPFTSANLTPDKKTGLPENSTREQFINTIRTGHDPEPPHNFLQVMPWPVYRHMTDVDLSAIYEYLSAIPHAEPGTACTGGGE